VRPAISLTCLASVYFSVTFKVEHSEAAYITNPIHMNGEFFEEVDDFFTTVWQRKPQYKRRSYYAQNLFQEYRDFQIIESTEFPFDL
jgi:hypothetical protein